MREKPTSPLEEYRKRKAREDWKRQKLLREKRIQEGKEKEK